VRGVHERLPEESLELPGRRLVDVSAEMVIDAGTYVFTLTDGRDQWTGSVPRIGGRDRAGTGRRPPVTSSGA
jgi:hypothetical protein